MHSNLVFQLTYYHEGTGKAKLDNSGVHFDRIMTPIYTKKLKIWLSFVFWSTLLLKYHSYCFQTCQHLTNYHKGIVQAKLCNSDWHFDSMAQYLYLAKCRNFGISVCSFTSLGSKPNNIKE